MATRPDQTPSSAQPDVQHVGQYEETDRFSLTLDGHAALAGPHRALVWDPRGDHQVVDLASLAP